jgi:hypothetical protein
MRRCRRSDHEFPGFCNLFSRGLCVSAGGDARPNNTGKSARRRLLLSAAGGPIYEMPRVQQFARLSSSQVDLVCEGSPSPKVVIERNNVGQLGHRVSAWGTGQ